MNGHERIRKGFEMNKIVAYVLTVIICITAMTMPPSADFKDSETAVFAF